MQKFPKVLVISHNPFSKTQNNGKTLASFFSGWPNSDLIQLFLTLDEIDTDICSSFFRISDVDVLKAWLFKRHDYGVSLNKSNISQFNLDKSKMHQSKFYVFIRDLFQKRYPLMMLCRNYVWNRVKPWQNEVLNDWLDINKPDIIFFQSSNVYAIFDMVDYISCKLNIPVIMETTDDYLSTRFSLSIFKYINIYKMRKRYKKMVRKAYCTFVIGDAMKMEYENKFPGRYEVALNSINISEKVTNYKYKKNNIVFVYAGNLGLNRWKVLSKIGTALHQIREKHGINSRLDIYSANVPNKKFQNIINTNQHINFCGKVSPDGLIEIKNSADFLVHVESFDKKNVEITRLSISTKIPEYLVSNRCIVAVGPEQVASIKYLKENNIAFVINDCKKIENRIFELLCDQKQIQKYIDNGINIAKERHDCNKNSKLIQKYIINGVKESGGKSEKSK